jgi:TPR repeat protein
VTRSSHTRRLIGFAIALALALGGFFTAAYAQSDKNKAAFEVGVKAYESGDYLAAFKAWLPLAYESDPAAQRNLGHLYRLGLGVTQDFAKAAEWYTRAADAGLARAQANLANMYLRGQGVEKDPAEAAKWFEKAAKQGHVVSQYNLGLLYENGLGIAADDVEAVKWYYLATKGGHAKALAKLALLISKNAPPELAQMLSGQGTGEATRTPVKADAPAAPNPTRAPAPKASEPKATPPADSKSDDDEFNAARAQTAAPTIAALAPTATAPSSRNNAGENKDNKGGFLSSLKSLLAPASEGLIGNDESRAAAAPPPVPTPAPAPTVAPVSPPTAVASAPSSAVARPVAPPAVAAEEGSKNTTVAAIPAVPTSSILDSGMIAYRARDYRTAIANWLPLAEAGNATAQFFLGGLYANGAGVPRDIIRAHVWWSIAVASGHDKARELLETLKLEMEPDQLAAAGLLAKSIVKKP